MHQELRREFEKKVVGDDEDWDDTLAGKGGSSNDMSTTHDPDGASNAPASEVPYAGADHRRCWSGRQTNPVVTGDADSEKWTWGGRAKWWQSNDRWSGR